LDIGVEATGLSGEVGTVCSIRCMIERERRPTSASPEVTTATLEHRDDDA
jgi:hypothetical protein